jgi:uncharacterized protein (TIGR02246 family)
MKKLVSVVFVLSILVPYPLLAAPEDEVKAVFERFVVAQNAHDLKAVGELLLDAPHFLRITRGTPIWGREAALKRFEALYQGTWRLEPDTAALRVMMVGDNAAHVYVPIVFSIGAPGQDAQTTRFLMNQILVKTSGGWRVASILPIPVPPQ